MGVIEPEILRPGIVIKVTVIPVSRCKVSFHPSVCVARAVVRTKPITEQERVPPVGGADTSNMHDGALIRVDTGVQPLLPLIGTCVTASGIVATDARCVRSDVLHVDESRGPEVSIRLIELFEPRDSDLQVDDLLRGKPWHRGRTDVVNERPYTAEGQCMH